MIGSRPTRIRRARLVPIALTTAALSSAVLGASVTGTLSAFNATITNSNNTAVAGSLVMQEFAQDGSTSCLSSTGNTNNTNASCSTINKYTSGSQPDFVPGTTHLNTVRFANLGTSDVNGFTLKPDVCTPHRATATGGMDVDDLCSSLRLTVTCAPVTGGTNGTGGTVGTPVPVYTDVTLTSIAGDTVDLRGKSTDCVPLKNSGNTVQFAFALKMPSDQNNKVQGQDLTQALTWTFEGATGV